MAWMAEEGSLLSSSASISRFVDKWNERLDIKKLHRWVKHTSTTFDLLSVAHALTDRAVKKHATRTAFSQLFQSLSGNLVENKSVMHLRQSPINT